MSVLQGWKRRASLPRFGLIYSSPVLDSKWRPFHQVPGGKPPVLDAHTENLAPKWWTTASFKHRCTKVKSCSKGLGNCQFIVNLGMHFSCIKMNFMHAICKSSTSGAPVPVQCTSPSLLFDGFQFFYLFLSE